MIEHGYSPEDAHRSWARYPSLAHFHIFTSRFKKKHGPPCRKMRVETPSFVFSLHPSTLFFVACGEESCRG